MVSDEKESEPGEGSVAQSEAGPSSDSIDVTEVERERDQYMAMLQRERADFENYKKRAIREGEVASHRGVKNLLTELLPVLDAFDLAAAHYLSSGSEEGKTLVQIQQLLLDTLVKEGLERFGVEGDHFDPQVHEAVAHIQDEGDEQLVDGVLRAGYRWKGVVLRPAMVRVKG